VNSAKRISNRSLGVTSTIMPSTTREPLLINGTDRQFRRFVDNFVRLSARLQTLRAALAKGMGMTPPQYNILMILARADAPEGETMSGIAKRLGVSLSFVVSQTRILDHLGLIELCRNPADQRSVLATVTQAGRKRIARVAPKIQQVNDLLFSSLTRRELIAMDRTISRILDGSEAATAVLRSGSRRGNSGGGATSRGISLK
jgi:MarR family transcriptional regulator, organic hydroperoxide resistance regulator